MGRKKKKQTPASLRGRKKGKRERYLIDCLQLPGDAVMGMELATLCGDRELTFRCFKNLRSVSSSEVLLQAKRHDIRICGDCLELTYYTMEEVKIRGNIRSIQYEQKG